MDSSVAYVSTIQIRIARVMKADSNVASSINTLAMAGLRIAVGCLFLVFAQYKVFGTQFTEVWIALVL